MAINRYSGFRFSEECSDDIRLCIVADDSVFGGPTVAIEVPLDGPSECDDGLALVARIVAALNG